MERYFKLLTLHTALKMEYIFTGENYYEFGVFKEEDKVKSTTLGKSTIFSLQDIQKSTFIPEDKKSLLNESLSEPLDLIEVEPSVFLYAFELSADYIENLKFLETQYKELEQVEEQIKAAIPVELIEKQRVLYDIIFSKTPKQLYV